MFHFGLYQKIPVWRHPGDESNPEFWDPKNPEWRIFNLGGRDRRFFGLKNQESYEIIIPGTEDFENLEIFILGPGIRDF